MDQLFPHILYLLAAAVLVVFLFHRLRIPSSLGYLLVGVLLGPEVFAVLVEGQQIRALAEFGIVFLLFTIGLNFSLPQIYALRHQVLGLGTGQVVFTTLVVGLMAWLAGMPVATAFVIGAVFAQSSTTIITKQLGEQGEDVSRHGRLGTAISVFQDVTAVPFVVIIPVLGMAASADLMASALGWALAKAVAAFALVYVAGRWLLRPLFHLVASMRSAEVFTLTVLGVSLLAAWTTSALGLSMAFGAFLAGMMLGDTEFRHQVESTIRPFRDVLLGLFFVGIGMLFDPFSLPAIWHWALLGACLLMLVKILLVAQIVRWAGLDPLTAWRTGILLAVGGEFGFALLALGLDAKIIDEQLAQIVLTSVLFSMVFAPFLIRYNHGLASFFARCKPEKMDDNLPGIEELKSTDLRDHVILCGYGRIGQSLARFLEAEHIPYVALDLDPTKVREAHLAGQSVFYGDAAERDLLESLGLEKARLMVIAHEDVAAAHKALNHIRQLRRDLPVMVRTRDEGPVETLRRAGATEVVPETLEAALMIASQALLLLKVPSKRVMHLIQEQRESHYQSLKGYFRGVSVLEDEEESSLERLRAFELGEECSLLGKSLSELALPEVVITTLVRDGQRHTNPSQTLRLQSGDRLVLFGTRENLERAERYLLSI